MSISGAVHRRTGDAAGGEWSNCGVGVGVRRGETGRPNGIVEPRRANREGGDGRNGAFGGGAGRQ